MKTPILAGLALLLAATAAQAATSEPDRYSRWASGRASRLLHDRGLETRGAGAMVRASVDADGMTTGILVLHSSGSEEDDVKVKAVLRKVLNERPLTGLKDGAVTLTVRSGAFTEARRP
jgi:hypothetical protein